MPVDVLPEYGPVTVEVQTEALGLSSAEVEQLITVPIEQDLLNGVAFLKASARSRSRPVADLPRLRSGNRSVHRTAGGRRAHDAGARAAERLEAAANPPAPVVDEPRAHGRRPYEVPLADPDVGARPLDDHPAPARRTRRGQRSIWGERARQLQVQVDPQKLSAANVSLQQVIDTAGNALWVSPLTYLEASTPGTGGFIDTANQRLGIQHISPITTPESLGRVTLEGTKKQLGDVATVVEDHPPLIGDALTAAGPGLMFVVEKAPGASTLDVTRQTEDAIREMQPGLPGVTFDSTVFRPATYIQHGISNLETTLIVAAILALLALARLPVALARRPDPSHHGAVVAGRCGARARPLRRDDERDRLRRTARGARARHRRRDRDDGFDPSPDARGRRRVDGERDRPRVARRAQRKRLRDAGRRCGNRARLLPGAGPGRILPGGRHLLPARAAGGSCGLDHCHAGAGGPDTDPEIGRGASLRSSGCCGGPTASRFRA